MGTDFSRCPKNTSRRVGVSNGQIIVFDETSPGVYHGHVRSWQELTQPMKNALIENGLVNRHGKILPPRR